MGLLNREDGLNGIWHGTNTIRLDRAEWLDSDLKCTRTHQVQMATGVYFSGITPYQNKAADHFVRQSFSCHQTSLLVSDVTVRYFSRPSFLDYLNNSHFVSAYGMCSAEQSPFMWQFGFRHQELLCLDSNSKMYFPHIKVICLFLFVAKSFFKKEDWKRAIGLC